VNVNTVNNHGLQRLLGHTTTGFRRNHLQQAQVSFGTDHKDTAVQFIPSADYEEYCCEYQDEEEEEDVAVKGRLTPKCFRAIVNSHFDLMQRRIAMSQSWYDNGLISRDEHHKHIENGQDFFQRMVSVHAANVKEFQNPDADIEVRLQRFFDSINGYLRLPLEESSERLQNIIDSFTSTFTNSKASNFSVLAMVQTEKPIRADIQLHFEVDATNKINKSV
jgi:hypothetical protein